ncbi:hypothetical protein [uncultured Aquimarina sp.]|uniref:hypothetical protein n=1 Tax=uncultured Aquimarina sp. TaxID=575652 RepID=UPI00260C409E|nr:hypothetical protein [uncultured Aquimarina sp.]
MDLIKTYILSFVIVITSCSDKNKNQEKEQPLINQIEKESTDTFVKSDTLEVGYTYWWPENGPFIGNCGEQYSLVFLGTIHEVYKKTEQQQYASQMGVIKVDKVLIAAALKNKTYQDEQYVTSDCFAQVDAKKGDKVLVFCYEYEGSISIPGGKSILKINDSSDPIVASIKRYIGSNQNPLSIEDDLHIWEEIELGSELSQIISCKKTLSKNKF